jgi:hypothetical protein
MVGIGARIPHYDNNETRDIRLGDVAISSGREPNGVVVYDFGNGLQMTRSRIYMRWIDRQSFNNKGVYFLRSALGTMISKNNLKCTCCLCYLLFVKSLI